MDPFTYRAHIIYVVDGDTVDVDIDLGFGICMRAQRIRLYGINAPERRTKKGKAVKEVLTTMIENQDVLLRTLRDKKGKYGRWLGIIEDNTVGNINDWLVNNHMAVRRNY